MSIETFTIGVSLWNSSKRYRMTVDHFYSSDQVERFKIHGKNDRFIIMEKRLNIHKQPWKVTEGDFNPENIQQTAAAIFDIQAALDNYLDDRAGKNRGKYPAPRPLH
jgi:hypothetical protein